MFGITVWRVFLVLILVAAIVAGSQYAPAYFFAIQFNDFIRQEVKYAAAARKSTDVITREVLDKAKELKIPITARDVHITRRGPSFTLDLDYGWPIDLRVYQHELRFHASVSGESFEK